MKTVKRQTKKLGLHSDEFIEIFLGLTEQFIPKLALNYSQLPEPFPPEFNSLQKDYQINEFINLCDSGMLRIVQNEISNGREFEYWLEYWSEEKSHYLSF